MPAPDDLYERLRRLAVEDPMEARRLFLKSFEASGTDIGELFSRLRRPSEGRLRQVVANAIRSHPGKSRIVPELLRWRETETDEFTRRAIAGALVGVDDKSIREDSPQRDVVALNELASVYRYVSGRLRHRLRNTILGVQAYADRINKLRAADPGVGDDVRTTVARLNDAMISLGRELEATDVDPEHFQQRSVGLADWLRQLNLRYAVRYSPISLTLMNADATPIRISASDYFLETIFWNIWLNAHQAKRDDCEITIAFETAGNDIILLVADNGPGFPPETKDILFQQVYSTKTSGRGRGMMEIQDAVERIDGRIDLCETAAGEYRLRIRLPLEAQ